MITRQKTIPPSCHKLDTLNRNKFTPPSKKRSPANQSTGYHVHIWKGNWNKRLTFSHKRSPANQSIGYHVHIWKGRWPNIRDSWTIAISGVVINTRFTSVTYYDSISRMDVYDQGMCGVPGTGMALTGTHGTYSN